MSDITLGIIGSGQLGSMMCQAAKKLNVKTVVISNDEEGPAQNYCDQFIYSKYDNQITTTRIQTTHSSAFISITPSLCH